MRIAIAVVLSAVAAGCAEAPPKPKAAEEHVVVLPGPDGKTGTVVVQRGGARQVLDQPYAASRIAADGRQSAARASEQEVRAAFGSTLGAMPARPAAFLLYFMTGKDELTPESKADLQKVLEELKRRPSPDVVAIGHTDSVGAQELNDRLSLQRAERVKALLAGIGIPAERIYVAGRGKRELLVPTAENVDEPRNRRVEINVR
jgi:outer membrane protein OmpA-like peptidoglycan-associated protein